MRFVLAAIFALACVSAQAKDLTVTLTDAEQQTFVESLDALAKAQGINRVMAIAVIFQKLQQAAQQPDPPKVETFK